MNKKDNISSTLYVCKICGRRVPKGSPMFANCEYQQLCGNCYLKEEDRKEQGKR